MLENKIPPPLVMVIFLIMMWLLSLINLNVELDFLWQALGVSFFLLVGMGFAVGGVMSFKKAETTVNPLKPETATSLVSSGIYRFTRNPMYVGLSCVLLAWAIFLASIPAFLLMPLFVLYIDRFQIIPEERALEKLFGEAFVNYKAEVRRWL